MSSFGTFLDIGQGLPGQGRLVPIQNYRGSIRRIDRSPIVLDGHLHLSLDTMSLEI